VRKRSVIVLSSKNPRKIQLFDSLIVSGFFLSLLPVRVAFTVLVGDHWLGSFGILTIITVTVIYFSYKNKLGWFGRCLQRFFTRKHTKKKILLFINIFFVIGVISLFIYAIHYSDGKFDYEKSEVIALLPNEGMGTIEELSEQAVNTVVENPAMFVLAFFIFIGLIFFDFNQFALIMWTINEISGGIYINMATIVLIEEIEVLGMFVLFHFIGKRIKKDTQT